MKTNRGKGYFYSLGSREAASRYRKTPLRLRNWPRWVKEAYSKGFNETAVWEAQ